MLDPVRTLSIFQRQPDPQSFSSGQAVFKEGEPGDLMYGVLEGEIALSVNEKIVETIVPGGVFGIGALVSSSVRTYTAIAQTDCKLAFLDEERFLFVVQETPFFALEVMKSYSERLNRLVRHLVEKLIV